MTKEDIFRMAREAKFATEERGDGLHHVFVFNFQGSETEITEELERFAALVASAEREACALICENFSDHDSSMKYLQQHAYIIRARGQA